MKVKFGHTLAECRDAYPVPEVGSELEGLWGQAMGDPASVGAYVKACAISQKKEIDELRAELERIKANPIIQFRKPYCADWFDGYPDPTDDGGPYETRTLYALGSKTA